MHSKAAKFWSVLFGHRLYSSFCRVGCVLFAACALAGCTSTSDSLGHDNATVTGTPTPASLLPITRPDTYDNAIHDLQIDMDVQDIYDRVQAVYDQLFHGDTNYQAIYFKQGDDEAYIKDLYHGDIRTEGNSLGMLISVELNRQEEFDKLWNYAKREQRIQSGAGAGYFNSFCDNTNGVMACADPYGLQMFAMSLIFAHDRWGASTLGSIDYEADALELFDVMLNKEKANGGVLENYTDTFDDETLLVFDVPNINISHATQTRPSILMPAFYELWAEATGNSFFRAAAQAARSFIPTVADANTGLMPLRAYFDGTPVPGSDTFQTEAYRAFPNLVLDAIWTSNSMWTNEFNRVLAFFVSQNIDKYGSAYELNGTVVSGKTDHEVALVFVNSMTALKAMGVSDPKAPSTSLKESDRQRFIQAAWSQDTPTGSVRYYQGIMQLFALCVLSGNMRVW